MTGDQLRALGVLLYGPNWQTPLARDLSIAVRNVQRWTSGTFRIPQSILPRFAKLCRAKAKDLKEHAERLERLANHLDVEAETGDDDPMGTHHGRNA